MKEARHRKDTYCMTPLRRNTWDRHMRPLEVVRVWEEGERGIIAHWGQGFR